MSLKVNWSDRLEDLAEGLFGQWESAASSNPFSRVCIVVDDMATRNWLQHYFLFRRKGGKRKILANIEFKPLPEFVAGHRNVPGADLSPRILTSCKLQGSLVEREQFDRNKWFQKAADAFAREC